MEGELPLGLPCHCLKTKSIETILLMRGEQSIVGSHVRYGPYHADIRIAVIAKAGGMKDKYSNRHQHPHYSIK
jgi:hypothetical protein